MKGGKEPLGYTIVEVLIVLAVSGLMFVIAANFINGKQQRTAFSQGVNEMASRIQGVINQVKDGQYSDIPQGCEFTGGVTSFDYTDPTTQGKNAQCVFLGKIIHLRKEDKPSDYEVLSLAGGRADINGKAITSLPAADPKVIGSLIDDQTVPQQLEIRNVTGRDENNAPFQSFAVGFFQGQGTVNDTGDLTNGSQTVSMYYRIGLTKPVNNSPAFFTDNFPQANFLKIAQEVTICITDDTRFAEIIIGNSNSQLNVRVRVVAVCT
jgi:prepilin-type N-terminal cleavage/methylation domain-containing protein